jgi:MFS family permease
MPEKTAGRSGPIAFLTLATLSQTGVSFVQQGIAVLGVFLAAAYQVPVTQIGTFVAAISLGWMVSAIFMGMLVDRVGPRSLLFCGAVVMAGVAAGLGWIHTLPIFYIMLFVLGCSLAAAPAAGTKAVLSAWSAYRRGLPMGIRQTGVPLGAMLAALLLPLMAGIVGVHVLFWGFAVILLAAGWAFGSVAPQARLPRGTPAAQPSVHRAAIKRIVLPGICGFLLGWGQYDLLTYSIPWLHDNAGLSIAAAGVALALAQVGGALGRIAFGIVSDRLSGKPERVLAVLAAAATGLAMALAFLPPHVPAVLLLGFWLCLGLGMVGWNALMVMWAGERVPIAHAGLAMSATASFVQGGATVAPPLFGWVLALTGRFQVAWLMLAGALLLATALLWTTTLRHHPPHVSQLAPADGAGPVKEICETR